MKTVFLALACFLLINTTPAFPQSGSLDNDFGIGGKVTTDIGNSSNICYAAAIQTDGKILLAGYSYVDGGYDFVLIRYNAEGTLDNTFGVAGKVTTDIRNCQYNCSDRGRAVIIQSDGKILLAGQSLNGGNTDYDFAMLRYNPNGTLDNTFGIAGKVITAIGGDADYGWAVLI